MHPLPVFIDDLVPLILQADDHWWPRDLATIASLSSTWLYYARKRLYQYPIIQSFSAAVKLATSLETNPLLESLVRGISLQPVGCERRPQKQELWAVRSLLGLDGLQRVTLGGELAVKAERFLRLISNPDDLQELHIDGSLLRERLNSPPSLEWDESLAFSLPNITKLRLTHVELDIAQASIPIPSSITSIVLEDVHIVNGHISQLLNGRKSLDRLHLTTSDPTAFQEQLRLVLASCVVACLHYETQKETKHSDIPFDIEAENLQSLRCLHLNGHFVDINILTAINETCRGLVELAVLGRAVRVSTEEWAHLLQSGAFSSLRRLGLPWGTNEPPFCRWPPAAVAQIQEACNFRKIPLRLY
ncbi:hypothetical protein CPC08DRAFT_701639 [Agrocybe pediades]|nr:hypothetical protein CPC08DRAFT_701639 [Agrocybe pediades]